MVASFDNKINTLVTKKREINTLLLKEKRVTQGYAVFEEHLIGLPLVADDNIGAILIRRKKGDPAFNDFDREVLSVVVEQSVTAIKNIQLYESQQDVILGSIKFIGQLLKRHGRATSKTNATVYFKIMEALAHKLNLSENAISSLYYASVLHDAGAIDVPYEILSKHERLTPEEFKVIRENPSRSVELIKPVAFLRPVLPIILYHHEKYDGTGYPSGLKKEEIPIGARIMAVVDSFEAMVVQRPYREKLTVKQAVQELKDNSGTQFDPLVIKAFMSLHAQKNFKKLLSSIHT